MLLPWIESVVVESCCVYFIFSTSTDIFFMFIYHTVNLPIAESDILPRNHNFIWSNLLYFSGASQLQFPEQDPSAQCCHEHEGTRKIHRQHWVIMQRAPLWILCTVIRPGTKKIKLIQNNNPSVPTKVVIVLQFSFLSDWVMLSEWAWMYY